MKPENKVYRLPDYYDKREKISNNWKILELQHQGTLFLNNEIEQIRNTSDVLKASGSELDVWGESLDVKRNGLPDEKYRIQILLQIARNMIQPDYTSWYQVVLDTLQCSPDDLKISGTGDPFEYRFDRFPVKSIEKTGLDLASALELIEGILPLTGRLTDLTYIAARGRRDIYTGTAVSRYTKYVARPMAMNQYTKRTAQVSPYASMFAYQKLTARPRKEA